jgi:hypothetical protein
MRAVLLFQTQTCLGPNRLKLDGRNLGGDNIINEGEVHEYISYFK